MAQQIVVVGAGLIGASIAAGLAKAGARVTVVDAGLPATGASGRSFGWINASFFHDDTHHRLRVAGMKAYRRLTAEHPELAVSWPGCLWWEAQGPALDDMEARLRALGYPVERLGQEGVRNHAPHLGEAPEEALLFPGEGVAEAGTLTVQLLQLARDRGAQVITGCAVERIELANGRVRGLCCEGGMIPADQVIVAAGNGSARLVADLGVELPMLRRPGALIHTRPVAPVLAHVMVSPALEFRQDSAGRIIAPSAESHQADATERFSSAPGELAADTLGRLGRLLPGVELTCEQVALALRPVPGDGLPVVGPCGAEGLYLAVMHSGVTLAALMGQLVADEVLRQKSAALLAPYRPNRFAGSADASR